jgi:hypothetical protein
LSGKHPGLQQSNKLNKKGVHPAIPKFGCQEGQLVTCRIAPRHAGLRVLAEQTGTIAWQVKNKKKTERKEKGKQARRRSNLGHRAYPTRYGVNVHIVTAT